MPNHRLPTAPGRKLGEILAETIENEIIAAGWKVGDVVGSESELCERYGVSRAVFREAIRIVGHHGVAEMRREAGRACDDYASNDFHLLLAELTGNPAMELFVQILSRVTSRHSTRAVSLEDTAKEVHRAHARIAEAILDRDIHTAQRRLHRHLDLVVEYLNP